MHDDDLSAQFKSMQESAPRLMTAFSWLTRAHSHFQGSGRLRTLSVSDVLDNGTIEATFHRVRIAFAFVPVFGARRTPRGRVIVMNCHCTYGHAVQDSLGSFSFGDDGVTDLDPDRDGHFPHMQEDAPGIVLRFLDAAFIANRTL